MTEYTSPVLNLPDAPRMLEIVRRELERATSVDFSVAFTTCSGLQLLIDPLREMLERGSGRARILTSTFQNFTQPEALDALHAFSSADPRLECRIQRGHQGFHTKYWAFAARGTNSSWVGSSNLTKSGLWDNIEWNIASQSNELARANTQHFERLWSRTDVAPLTREIIDGYREQYLAQPTRLRLEKPAVRLAVPNAAQQRALVELVRLRSEGKRRAAIIAATGLGKTMLAAMDVEQVRARRLLYVSHMKDHLEQAIEKAFLPRFGEKRIGRLFDGKHEIERDFVFATVQSLNEHKSLLDREWDYLVIDEFHHVEADSYRPLWKLRDRGLTATPDRSDGRDVLQWCDWNIALDVRLPEAIECKWLIPFHYFGIADESVELKNALKRSTFGEDELFEALARAERARAIHHWARLYGFDGPKRVSVGFCAGTRHADFMAAQFQSFGERAVSLSAKSHTFRERQVIYERLQDPNEDLQWLFVADLLNEGVDLPAINSILFLRPTESPTLFLQQLGRGLRLYPGTEVLTVLDFVGHHLAAWNPMRALLSTSGAGTMSSVAGTHLRPPMGCEIVLQRRTREMLEKIAGLQRNKERALDMLRSLENVLGRPPLPSDCVGEPMEPAEVRKPFGSWLGACEAAGVAPLWAKRVPGDAPLRAFLRSLEVDWQAPRVTAYATAWALAESPGSVEEGLDRFFEKFPQWQVERDSDGLATARKKIKEAACWSGHALSKSVLEAIGHDELMKEIEGRLVPRLQQDWLLRHGSPLSTPDKLVSFAALSRPEIVRHFGVHYP